MDQDKRQGKNADDDMSGGCFEAARLVEEPQYLGTHLDTVGCLLFDPVDDIVACAGRGGAVRMMNYTTKKCSSAFHVSGTGKRPQFSC